MDTTGSQGEAAARSPVSILRGRNLAAYFGDQPETAEALRLHAPRELEVLRARSGAVTLRCRGQLLHSSIDPEAEAESFFSDDVAARAKLLVLFGLGAGHVLRAARKRAQGRLVVFEPDHDVLAFALDSLDLRGEPSLRPDAIASDLAALRSHLARLHGVGDVIALAVPPAYARVFPEAARSVAEEVQLFGEQARLSDNTYDQRLQLWIDNLVDNLPQRARLASASRLEGSFRGFPGIVVSAGPSLAKNIDVLRAFEDRAVLLSSNTAYRALERAGVRPDLVMGLEALDVTPQFDGLSRLCETRALLDGVAHPNLFRLPFKGGFVFDDGIPFYQSWLAGRFAPLTDWSCGLCVAHAAFSALRAMGCDPIILVGQDLAHTGGRVYAQGTFFEKMTATPSGGSTVLGNAEAKLAIDRRSGNAGAGMKTFVNEEPRVVLPGYHGGEVESTIAFRAFARWFENAAGRMRSERTLLNCTEGGARIGGFEQRPLADVARTFARASGVRQELDARAGEPAFTSSEVASRCRDAAGEIAAIALAARKAARASRRGDDLDRERATSHLRALTKEHGLVNGYVRREVNEVRDRIKAGEAEPARLFEVIERGADRLAKRLRAAAVAVVDKGS